jgi:hypothetical protein
MTEYKFYSAHIPCTCSELKNRDCCLHAGSETSLFKRVDWRLYNKTAPESDIGYRPIVGIMGGNGISLYN